MKYMQNGGYQNNPFMRLTLALTLVFLVGFVATNFLLYFERMDLTPASVVKYYNGAEEEFHPARSYQSMMEVTHMHLPMMALVLLLLTHLVIFAPFSRSSKIALILIPFLAGLFGEASSWLVRYIHPAFAWLKIFSFLALQASVLFLLASLALFLLHLTPVGKQDDNTNGASHDDRSQLPSHKEPRRQHLHNKERRRPVETLKRQ